MHTLHVGPRVSDLDRSLAFCTAVGYTVAGTVEDTAIGRLSMLQLPGDQFVTIELVHDPAEGKAGPGSGINHLVIQVESLDATVTDLGAKGSRPSRQGVPAARTDRRPAESPIQTVTGSSWSSGRPATPTVSPAPTSPEPADRLTCQRPLSPRP